MDEIFAFPSDTERIALILSFVLFFVLYEGKQGLADFLFKTDEKFSRRCLSQRFYKKPNVNSNICSVLIWSRSSAVCPYGHTCRQLNR
jgi:hypothetical protein